MWRVNDCPRSDDGSGVLAAYGWPATLTDEQILERLVALNAERSAEEARGLIRWLRPEFQCPVGSDGLGGTGTANPPSTAKRIPPRRSGPTAPAAASGTPEDGKRARVAGSARRSEPTKQPWPAEQAARTRAVQEALAAAGEAASAADLAKRFQRARASTVEEILDALVSLGLAHKQRGGKYLA